MRAAALACLGLLSCASPPPAPRVERTEAAIDLSGEWNDVDADTVANAMIGDCLGGPWIQEWRDKHQQKRPVLRLYPVKNKTSGYIDYRYFTKQLEAAFVRSGLLDVVSARDEAEEVRAERADQAEHASDDTAKAQGEELGADFILNGWLLAQDDRADGQQVRAYLTSIEIVEVSSQRKAWVGQKRIKKLLRAATP